MGSGSPCLGSLPSAHSGSGGAPAAATWLGLQGVTAVGKVNSVTHEDMEVDVAFQARAKRLHRHNNAGPSPLFFLAAVSMATYLRRHPTPDDAVHEAAYLPMQASVKLEPFAQTHLLG